MAVDVETRGWNPQISLWQNAAYWAGSAIIEPLATYEPDGKVAMWLAESITPTVEGAFDSWRITVKPGIVFHNGEALTASVVKRNLELATAPQTMSGAIQGSKFKAMTVVDDRTLQVDLTEVWSTFPSALAGLTGMMMATAMIEAPFGGLDHPIGTGPFEFSSWVPNESLKLVRNPNYWRPGEPQLDTLEFRPITDNKAALSQLLAGDIDMMVSTKATDVSLARGMTVKRDYRSEKTFVLVSGDQSPSRAPNPFTDRHARLALAYGTDRAAIRNLVGGDQQLRTSTSPVVAGTRWSTPDDEAEPYEFDPARAREEVEAYRRDSGSPSLAFELSTSPAPDDLTIAQALADQWKAVGIDASIRAKDNQTQTVDIVLGNFDAVIEKNYGYTDPDADTQFFRSSEARGPGTLSVNFMQLRDPDIDAALSDVRRTTDVDRQRQDFHTVTEKLNDAAVNLWLYDTPYSVLAAPDIGGLEPLDDHPFGNFLPRPWLWGQVARLR